MEYKVRKMEEKITPRWWKRDPDTGEIIMGDEFITQFYPITTAAFTRDWSVEGEWNLSRSFYLNFGSYAISRDLLTKHKWETRLE